MLNGSKSLRVILAEVEETPLWAWAVLGTMGLATLNPVGPRKTGGAPRIIEDDRMKNDSLVLQAAPASQTDHEAIQDASAFHKNVPDISVVVPAKDERDNVTHLVREIAAALAGRLFDILVVDDGSRDGTAQALATLRDVPLRILRHDRSAGQSAALRSGLLAARGKWIATLDADGENDPGYLPEMIDAIRAAPASTGMVMGRRVDRKAAWPKRAASRLANALRRRLLGDNATDSGCGLKVLPRTLYLKLPYFDGWHRFMPALVIREGFDVTYIDVVDRPRRHGRSKYGVFDRAFIGSLDLFGVWWLMRRRRCNPRSYLVGAAALPHRDPMPAGQNREAKR